MKIVVYGLGGIGGYFGARLMQSGNNVIFISRGITIDKVLSEGLILESIKGNIHLNNVRITDNIQSVGDADLILLTVKAWQIKEIASSLKPLVGKNTSIIPLQNGVETVDTLLEYYDESNILAAMCRLVAFKTDHNKIKHTDVEPSITFGELDNSESKRVQRIKKVLNDAGIHAIIPSDIHSMIWQKFMFVASTSGVGAVTRSTLGMVRSIPESRNLLKRSMEEIRNIAIRKNIFMPDNIVEKNMERLDSLAYETTASTQRDIMEGRPSELKNLTGAVVKYGQELNVDTPVSNFIYASLLPIEMKARKMI